MNTSATHRRPFTEREQAAAKNLSRIWDEKRNTLKLTQEKAAHELGYSSQGAVYQYIRGQVPMNQATILKFAKLLKVHPTEIDPHIIELLPETVQETPADYDHSELNGSTDSPRYTEHEIRVVISEVENYLANSNITISPDKKAEVIMYLLPLWRDDQDQDKLKRQTERVLKLVVSN